MKTTQFPDLIPGNPNASPASIEAVQYLQSALLSQGLQLKPTGRYDSQTQAAVVYFQQTHQNSKGKPLEPDAWVGQQTWWAIQNPSGSTQRSFLEGGIPAGLSKPRQAILRAAIKEHQAGTHEIPDGSNYGDGVTKFLEGVGPAAWCCYSVSWVFKAATGSWPLGKRFGLCAALWAEAKKQGRTYTAEQKLPVPGDAFVLLYRGADGKLLGTGHTGFVSELGAEADLDKLLFGTLEGNMGNRFKRGRRPVQFSTLAGFIDLVGDADQVRGKFQRGFVSKKSDAVSSTHATTR